MSLFDNDWYSKARNQPLIYGWLLDDDAFFSTQHKSEMKTENTDINVEDEKIDKVEYHGKLISEEEKDNLEILKSEIQHHLSKQKTLSDFSMENIQKTYDKDFINKYNSHFTLLDKYGIKEAFYKDIASKNVSSISSHLTL